MMLKLSENGLHLVSSGAPAGGGMKFRPETEKNVIEQCCNFPKLYKMTMVLEECDRK